MKSPYWFALLFASSTCLLSFACGGVSEEGDGGDEASGGEPSTAGGGSGGSGNASGGSGTSAGATGGQETCCLADATCAPGETKIASQEDCPKGANCYESSICCSTVWCISADIQCDAAPFCPGPSVEVNMCPLGLPCSSETVCGTTIYCLEMEQNCNGYPSCPGGTKEVEQCPEGVTCTRQSLCGIAIQCMAEESEATCDPTDPQRQYVGDSPEACAVIDFDCDAGLQGFGDECGCGCEQDASCPSYIDCMPGGNVDALCSDPDRCPLTDRVY